MIHVFTNGIGYSKILSIQSMLNQQEFVTIWFNDEEEHDHHQLPESIGNHSRVAIRLASDELKEYREFKEALLIAPDGGKKTLAPYSDLIRLEILSKYGGWWLDDDIFLLRPLYNVMLAEDFYCAGDLTAHKDNKLDGVYPCNYAMYDANGVTSTNLLAGCHARMKLIGRSYDIKQRYHEYGPWLLYNAVLDNSFGISEDNVFPTNVFPSMIEFDDVQNMCTTQQLTYGHIQAVQNCIGLHMTGLIDRIKEYPNASCSCNYAFIDYLIDAIESGAHTPVHTILRNQHFNK